MEKLSIKGQLRLIRDECPDIWERIINDECVIDLGLLNGTCNGKSCRECWKQRLDGDKNDTVYNKGTA